jgi:Organic radical activating enzymes
VDNADSIKKGQHVDAEFPRYYDQELEDKIIESLKPSYIAGITLLGGEPFMNTNITVPLCQRIRKEFGNSKTIWSWTGYEWEELMQMIKLDFPLSKEQNELLNLIDVLVDGRYVDSIRQIDLQNNPRGINFRGSSNQRIIDVRASLSQGEIIERTDLYKGEVIVPRDQDFKKLKK